MCLFKQRKRKKYINFMEFNSRGAWIVNGYIGTRQYYGYTKAEAKNLYLQECANTDLFNHGCNF